MKKSKLIAVTPVLPAALCGQLLLAANRANSSTDRYAGQQIIAALATFEKDIPLELLKQAAAVTVIKSALAKLKTQLRFDDDDDLEEYLAEDYPEDVVEDLADADVEVLDAIAKESAQLPGLLDAVHAGLAALSGAPAPGALEQLRADASAAADFSLGEGLLGTVADEALTLSRLLVELGAVAEPNFK